VRPPRLVATDLDGTLVRSDRTISDYTAGVLRELDAAGVPVVFVTGRPLRWATPVFDHVGSHGLAIVSNGALVWDVTESREVLERAMAAEVALEVAELIRDAVPGTAFGAETAHRFGVEPGFRQPYQVEEIPIGPLTDHVTGPILKLVARHEELAPDEFADAATGVVGELATVTHSSDRVSLLEIGARDVTKGSTLELVARRLGVEGDDVIAFGDMPNDIAMLSWAGTGYAMADAHPRVRACTPHLAPGHDEDGVARVLAEVFGLG